MCFRWSFPMRTRIRTATTLSSRLSPPRREWGSPALQLAGSEEESGERWSELPFLLTYNPLYGVKPGATTLLHGISEELPGEHVALAFQRYGRGKSLSLAVQDTWIWQMQLPLEDDTHEIFWRQLFALAGGRRARSGHRGSSPGPRGAGRDRAAHGGGQRFHLPGLEQQRRRGHGGPPLSGRRSSWGWIGRWTATMGNTKPTSSLRKRACTR